MNNKTVHCTKVTAKKAFQKFHRLLFKATEIGRVIGLLFLLVGICAVSLRAQLPNDFQKVELLTGLSNATTMQFAPDGRIFILDRFGEVKIYHPDMQTTVLAGTLPVFHEFEDGLIGIAFDPNFLDNDYIYLHYSVLSSSLNRVSRFTMNGDILDLNSEITLLEWPVQRTLSYHAGGDMAFDSQGNLYVATGDNTDHGAYGALNESNNTKSAEKSSSNSNDYRGKILRIIPQTNGTYTIPNGNLFPNGVGGLPEIYVMGARNPYRIFVDKTNTDWLFWGEVGPDANSASAAGPEGLDEMNLVKSAGNYGWPYFSGKNEAYRVPYADTPYYNDPNSPQNISTWNTGATTLPPARPSWLEFFHRSYFAGPRYYYDGTLADQQRFPVEFDEMFFYYDFNTSRIWAVKMDASGTILNDAQFAPSVFPVSQNGFIDMEFGPDGHMYILEYGTGCCPNNSGTGKLVRVDYTGVISNSPPTVVADADITSGSLPLTINFSSAGTLDPNGDSPLTYAWDFQTDGIVDSTQENPTFIYTTAGTFNAQLKVDDGKGGIGVQNVTIHAGNNAATFTFNSPIDGGFMNWDDDVYFDLTVNDVEDGSTSNGIDCSAINVIPSLGHLNHFHDGATGNGCPKSLALEAGSHDTTGEMDIFYVLNTNYTDAGGLTSFDQLILHPKRKEAEFYSGGSGIDKIANTDTAGGGSEAIRVDHEGYINFTGRNLLNLNAVRYRVAASAAGATIEFRVGSVTGPVLATSTVPVTGSPNIWVDVESAFTDPGGKNDIYFVFKNNVGQQNIFDLNYIEFVGPGVSVDNSPPKVVAVTTINTTQLSIKFSEEVEEASAETLANYAIDNGIVVTAAVLQQNNRTVTLTHSPLLTGTPYNLSLSNVENMVGLPVAANSYPLSIFDPIRINVGGPQAIIDGKPFLADQYATGGSLFTNTIPISGTVDDVIYQTERFGTFSYSIPVPIAGEYDIRLHFAELYFRVGSTTGGQGSRVFSVTVEDIPVLTDFDISAEVAPTSALIKDFDDISITDGMATIQFNATVENPKVSAIEILPADTFSVAPTITINSPTNGASLNQQFDISFTVQNWEIAEGSTHMHYYIDDIMVEPYYSYAPLNINGLSLGSHTIKLELFNPNHTGTGVFDEVTVNVTNQAVCGNTPFPDQWQVHELESSELPYRAVYILPQEDLDGDGLKDIVTGGWWYKNPGSASGNWVRKTIGDPLKNVAYLHDFDNDGDIDLLGTRGDYISADMAWAQNDGSGNFTVRTNIPSGRTTYWEKKIQGITGGVFQPGGPYQIAINWNGAESSGSTVQMLTVPNDPVNTAWTLDDISPDSIGEELLSADMDSDGDLDLFQSSNWLRNNGNGTWTTIPTGIDYITNPDRAQLADFDGDGDLDAVVGQLGIGTSSSDRMEFAWFEAPPDPTGNWVKHVLATDISSSLSLFTTDLDFDGDEDIVVGEWKGNNRLLVFENDLCNSGTWLRQTIDAGGTGFDHHDGAQVVDIDNDDDLDIISIGWDNIVPRIFENRSVTTNVPPTADAGEDRSIALPASGIVLNGFGSDPDGPQVTYLWTQLSGPNSATLENTTTADLTASNLVEGDYVFRLTVTDNENDTAYAETTVTVLPEITTGGDFALRINAGGPQTTINGQDYTADQYFNTGSVLDRPQTGLSQPYRSLRYSRSQTMSYDLPVPDGTYIVKLHFAETWFGATGGGAGVAGNRVFDVRMENVLVEDNLDVFAEVGAENPLVKTHVVNVTGGILDIDFSSLAADGGSRHPIIGAIEVLGSGDPSIPPIVEAGNNRTITLPATTSTTFYGSGEDPDGGPVTFLWTQVSGPNSAILSDEITADLFVTGLLEGTYVFRLTVTDNDNDTASDEVTLTVQSSGVGQAPTVNAGGNRNVNLPTANITLSGSGSDPDGGPVTFLWTQRNGPNTATLTNANTVNLTATNLVAGDYTFRLTVIDEENDTVFEEVNVTVFPEPTGGDFALRINAGGPQTIYNGNEFIADQFFDTGATLNRPQTGLSQPQSSFRFSRSQIMEYNIPVADGQYTVLLHFAELWFGATGGGSGGVGSRIFDVLIEGQLVEDNLDVFEEAGPDGALVKSYVANVSGGILDIDFSSLSAIGGQRHPIINAIEILGSGIGTSAPPVVDAGEDQIITLPSDSITLNGSGSDPDGGSVSYGWTRLSGPGTTSLSNITTPNLTAADLEVGNHVFRLWVTDDENETAFDETTVTVRPQQTQLADQLWLEAECAVVGSNWTILNDGSTSGGQYVQSPSGNNFSAAPNDVASYVSFNFSVESGTYRLFALVDAPTGSNDSFWVRSNEGVWLKWNYILGDGDFNWRQLHDRERRTVFVTLDLPQGFNTIDFAHREEGVGLDKIYITKTGGLPSGNGGADFSCGQSGKGGNQNIAAEPNQIGRSQPIINTVNIFPNPADEEVQVILSGGKSEISEVTIYDAGGKMVARRDGKNSIIRSGVYSLNISALTNGVYILNISMRDGTSSQSKLVIIN